MPRCPTCYQEPRDPRGPALLGLVVPSSPELRPVPSSTLELPPTCSHGLAGGCRAGFPQLPFSRVGTLCLALRSVSCVIGRRVILSS